MGCFLSREEWTNRSKKYHPFTDPDEENSPGESTSQYENENLLSSENTEKKCDEKDISTSGSANSVNSVYANITKFEELNKESSKSPSLIKISKANIDPTSKTFTNVSYFEKIEASARKIPDLDGGNEIVKLEESKIRTTVSNFENLERLKSNKMSRTAPSTKSISGKSPTLITAVPKRYVSLNKIDLA